MPYPTYLPTQVNINFESKIINKVLHLLAMEQKRDLLWRIGKALVNPEDDGTVMV